VIFFYVITFALANVVTAATDPADVGPFIVTWGTWFIALTFIQRDAIQVRYGRRTAYMAIAAALVASMVASALLGDTLAIVVAAGVSILIGESADTEIFTRLRVGLPARVLTSGVVGGTIDSALFVLIGLSPLWSGILPWSAVPEAIVGVALVKAFMQVVGAVGVSVRREVMA
jgi:uncharacterized PurR-regulated membrane protein YhhQ (DUF165 family)